MPHPNNKITSSNSPKNPHNPIISSRLEMMMCLRLVGLVFRIQRTHPSMAKWGVWSAVLSVGASLRRTESRSIFRLAERLNRNEKSLMLNKWGRRLMRPVKVLSKILTLRNSRIDNHKSLLRSKRVKYQNGNYSRCSCAKASATPYSLLITIWARAEAVWTMELLHSSRWMKMTEWCVTSAAESSTKMQPIDT